MTCICIEAIHLAIRYSKHYTLFLIAVTFNEGKVNFTKEMIACNEIFGKNGLETVWEQ